VREDRFALGAPTDGGIAALKASLAGHSSAELKSVTALRVVTPVLAGATGGRPAQLDDSPPACRVIVRKIRKRDRLTFARIWFTRICIVTTKPVASLSC
jgi:hypothetical protein